MLCGKNLAFVGWLFGWFRVGVGDRWRSVLGWGWVDLGGGLGLDGGVILGLTGEVFTTVLMTFYARTFCHLPAGLCLRNGCLPLFCRCSRP